MNSKNKKIIEVVSATRCFDLDNKQITVLNNINLEIYENDFITIFGPSGCGKTTLLNILSGVDIPTEGFVEYNHRNLFSLNEDQRALFRLKNIGIVYQASYWIKSLNVLENIALPLILAGKKRSNAMRRARELLVELNISRLAKKQPYQLSSGEQQKIGVARALVMDPPVIIADEPSGNLDSKSVKSLMNLFCRLGRDFGKTIIMVTHNEEYEDIGNRVVKMKDGEIITDKITNG